MNGNDAKEQAANTAHVHAVEQAAAQALVEEKESESRFRHYGKGPWAAAISALAVVFSLFQMYASTFSAFDAMTLRSWHIIFLLVLSFLMYPAWKGERRSRTRPTLFDALCIAAGLFSFGYLILNYTEITLRGGYFLRAESFYQTATMEEAYADAQHPSKKYHERSHGESFLALADDHFNRPGLFFLDEPEAALSWQHQLTLAFMISESLALGSQFIIATHSPLLMSIPDACLLHFGPDGISPCTVEETESWQIMTLLVSHRDQLFNHLLNKTEK
mgnify:CR=1 FL=1